MTERIRLAARYLKYIFTAGNRHDVHSPFVFSLVEEVLRDERTFYAFPAIEARRRTLLQSPRKIRVTDFGAGPQLGKPGERAVSRIARHAAKPPKYGQLLFRLVNYFQPQYILELGTSLGLSTAYMAAARQGSSVITMEGCPETARIAQETFASLDLTEIRIIPGNFDETLAPVLEELPRLDFAFLDGNHRKEPTLHYFSQCLAKTHNNTVLIFDDIHWTAEMEEAWQEICRHPSVTFTIDLFFVGLVFFREEFKEKQHFVLKY